VCERKRTANTHTHTRWSVFDVWGRCLLCVCGCRLCVGDILFLFLRVSDDGPALFLSLAHSHIRTFPHIPTILTSHTNTQEDTAHKRELQHEHRSVVSLETNYYPSSLPQPRRSGQIPSLPAKEPQTRQERPARAHTHTHTHLSLSLSLSFRGRDWSDPSADHSRTGKAERTERERGRERENCGDHQRQPKANSPSQVGGQTRGGWVKREREY
jgi:hypothetical protein